MHSTQTSIKRLLMIAFIGGLYFHLPIFALFLVGRGVSLSAVVTAQVFYSMASFLGEIPTGILADRFGHKRSVIIGNTLEIAGILLVVTFPSTGIVFLAYAIRGVGGSFISGAYEAWTFEMVRRAGRSYTPVASYQQILHLCGTVLSAAITGVLVELYGERAFPWLFVATTVSVGVFIALVTTLPPIRTQHEGHSPALWQGIVVPTWRLINRNITVRALVIVLILSLSGEFFLQGVYQPIFSQRAVQPIWLGLGFSLGAFVNMVLTFMLVRLHETIRFSNIQTLVTCALGALFLIFALSTHPLITVVSYVGLVGLFNTTEPIISQYINREVDSSIRSTVISAVSFVRTGFQVLMRLTLAGILGVFSPSIALALFGAYLVVGALIGKRTLASCGCTD